MFRYALVQILLHKLKKAAAKLKMHHLTFMWNNATPEQD